jgi:hypothetical protein
MSIWRLECIVAVCVFLYNDDVSGGGEQTHNQYPTIERCESILIVVIRTMYSTAGNVG